MSRPLNVFRKAARAIRRQSVHHHAKGLTSSTTATLKRVSTSDGNKLTIAFEKAGEKKVVDSFVERA